MPAPDGCLIGLAHLSLINTEPPKLVDHAATAGFDFVGVRVRAVTPHETPYDLQPGSPLLAETLERMADTGMVVRDIEFLLIDGSDQREAWIRMFEAGQALGAQSLTVACADPDLSRAMDTLAVMTQDGRPYGITPALEAISYQAVNSVPLAADFARHAGCDVLLDTLHLGRFGARAQELTAAARLAPLLQFCDAPAQEPVDREGLVRESRSERLVPGEGGLALMEILAALAEGLRGTPRAGARLPVSVEVPNDATLARLGEQGWADHLYRSTLALMGAGQGPTQLPDARSAEDVA